MSEVETITAADVAVVDASVLVGEASPAERATAINIRMSDLQVNLLSEVQCAELHEAKAAHSRGNAERLLAQIETLQAELLALPNGDGEA